MFVPRCLTPGVSTSFRRKPTRTNPSGWDRGLIKRLPRNGAISMSFLKTVWRRWRAFGKVMGDFVTRIFMTVFYFTIAIPFGIGVRLFKDPLKMKSLETRWLKREERDDTIE